MGTEALAGLAIGELDFVVTGVLELARAVGIESASRVIVAVGVVERVARELRTLVEFAIEGLLVAVGDIPGDSRRLTPGHEKRPIVLLALRLSLADLAIVCTVVDNVGHVVDPTA